MNDPDLNRVGGLAVALAALFAVAWLAYGAGAGVWVVFVAVGLAVVAAGAYGSYFVIRTAVEHGMRRAAIAA
jgi:hypothetical protein